MEYKLPRTIRPVSTSTRAVARVTGQVIQQDLRVRVQQQMNWTRVTQLVILSCLGFGGDCRTF